MTQEEINSQTGVAQLARPDDNDAMVISGVAIGEDEITHHAEGDKFWPAEQLMAATESLKGVQLTKNHDHNRVEGVIGRVTDARYKEGVGILFEAEVHDTDVANKIEEGLLEVSVHAVHANGGWTEDGEMIAENIEFRDLSVVPRGAAASNEVQVGSMQPATLSEDLSALCEDTFGGSFEDALLETAREFDIELETHDGLDEVYAAWQDSINMSTAQLRSWSENPCSREASVRPTQVIRRNLRLLEKNKDEWTEQDIDDAKRTISFISRMSAQRPDAPMDGENGCPSKWAISLLNWAYNPFEALPSIPDDMEPVEELRLSEHGESEVEEVELGVHEVSYQGVTEDDWDAPNLEDFPPEYTDAQGNPKWDLVDDHFLYSENGFPPNKYTDLKFPVVSPAGMLNLSALRAAKSRAPQADIPEEDITRIQSMANELANREFGKDWGEDEDSAEESDDVTQETAESDSAESQSSLAENADNSQNSDTMTEENTDDVDVEALQSRVEELEEQNESLSAEVEAVRQEYADALCGDSAFSAEELADKFTVEELAEKYEEADLEIAEASAPDPATGSMESEETEASEETEENDEEVALLEEQIEQYDTMGWDGARREAEARLSELVDEDDE